MQAFVSQPSRQLHRRKKTCSLLWDFHHEAVGEPADSFFTKKRQRLLRELSHRRYDADRVSALRHQQSYQHEMKFKTTENQPIAFLQVELVSSKMVSEKQKNSTATCEPTNTSRWFITSGMLPQDWPTNLSRRSSHLSRYLPL
jgi:hypothetical protein